LKLEVPMEFLSHLTPPRLDFTEKYMRRNLPQIGFWGREAID